MFIIAALVACQIVLHSVWPYHWGTIYGDFFGLNNPLLKRRMGTVMFSNHNLQLQSTTQFIVLPVCLIKKFCFIEKTNMSSV